MSSFRPDRSPPAHSRRHPSATSRYERDGIFNIYGHRYRVTLFQNGKRLDCRKNPELWKATATQIIAFANKKKFLPQRPGSKTTIDLTKWSVIKTNNGKSSKPIKLNKQDVQTLKKCQVPTNDKGDDGVEEISLFEAFKQLAPKSSKKQSFASGSEATTDDDEFYSCATTEESSPEPEAATTTSTSKGGKAQKRAAPSQPILQNLQNTNQDLTAETMQAFLAVMDRQERGKIQIQVADKNQPVASAAATATSTTVKYKMYAKQKSDNHWVTLIADVEEHKIYIFDPGRKNDDRYGQMFGLVNLRNTDYPDPEITAFVNAQSDLTGFTTINIFKNNEVMELWEQNSGVYALQGTKELLALIIDNKLKPNGYEVKLRHQDLQNARTIRTNLSREIIHSNIPTNQTLFLFNFSDSSITKQPNCTPPARVSFAKRRGQAVTYIAQLSFTGFNQAVSHSESSSSPTSTAAAYASPYALPNFAPSASSHFPPANPRQTGVPMTSFTPLRERRLPEEEDDDFTEGSTSGSGSSSEDFSN